MAHSSEDDAGAENQLLLLYVSKSNK